MFSRSTGGREKKVPLPGEFREGDPPKKSLRAHGKKITLIILLSLKSGYQRNSFEKNLGEKKEEPTSLTKGGGERGLKRINGHGEWSMGCDVEAILSG